MCSYMWTMELCSFLNLHAWPSLPMYALRETSATDYGINQDKQNLFMVPLIVNSVFALQYTKYTVYKYTHTKQSTHWINRHINLNQLTTLHRDYKHSMDDSQRMLEAYICTQPLSICHAYSPCAYKTRPKGADFKLSKKSHCWTEFCQALTMSKYLEIYRWLSVLVLVHVSWLSRF